MSTTVHMMPIKDVINDTIKDTIKEYVDKKLKEQAEKTYEIISNLIEWNVSKEEFVKLLME